MDFDESKIDVDPDYARNNTALRKVIKKEQEGKKHNIVCFVMFTLIF